MREVGTGGDDRVAFETSYNNHVAQFGSDAPNQGFDPGLVWWVNYGTADDM